MSPRNLAFLIVLATSLFVFRTPLRALLHFSLRGDNLYDKYSYTLAIPFITLALAFFERRKIFASARYSIFMGISLLLTSLALNWAADEALWQLGEDAAHSTRIFALVIFWLGGFVLCYGTRAFGEGTFPLSFLFLTVPIPDVLLDKPVTAVQYGSTAVCSSIFSLSGVPVLRNGFEFTLSTVSIQVAKECSGIHSTLAILIISLLAGHLYLRTAWKKIVLVLCALPIVCLTNGLRIAGLTLLAECISPRFLQGNLHHKGGMGFFVLALVLLFAVLRLLRNGPRPETLEV